jgi:Flp pilus assembly protein protease CpaA
MIIMLFYIASVITLIALVAGSFTDIKKREVPDWVNYSLICCGLAFNLLYSLVNWDFSYIINSILGFLIFLIFALVMFYSGQWGGGDSKLLMALGAVFGINLEFLKMIYINIAGLFKPIYPVLYLELPFSVNLIANILLVGAAYGLLWSATMVVVNYKKFLKEANQMLKKVRKVQTYIIIFGLVLIMLSLIFLDYPLNLIASLFILLIFAVFYLGIFIKATENSCMLKYVEPMKLTEGDWIAKDIKVDGKYISGPKDLGINRKQIKKLVEFYRIGKVKKVLVKEGIPFVPSFLIAFILTLIYGNIFLLFV